jgi:transglutaminase-like putative cysteine protease
MRLLIREGKRNPLIRDLAVEIIRPVPAKRFYLEVVAIYDFVNARVRYTKDTWDAEMVQPAEWVLTNGAGDCDDFTVAVCALLEAVGHRTRIVAVGREAGSYTHVYAETLIGGKKWIAVDATEDCGVGWHMPYVQRMEISTN